MYKSSNGKEFEKREDWINYEKKLSDQRTETKLSTRAQEYAKKVRKNAIENNKKVKKQKAQKRLLQFKKNLFRVMLVTAGIYAGTKVIDNRDKITNNIYNTMSNTSENAYNFLDEHLKSTKTKALDYIGDQYYNDIIKHIEANEQSSGNYIINIHDANFMRYDTNVDDVYSYVDEKLSQENVNEDKNDIGWLIMVNSFYGDEDIANKYYKEPSKEKYEELAENYSNSKSRK